jgi:hypothetical protein
MRTVLLDPCNLQQNSSYEKYIIKCVLDRNIYFNLWSKRTRLAKSKKDLYNDKVNLDKWFKNFEIGSIDDFTVTQKGEGAYKTYSNRANNSVYKYIYEPDLLTYTFEAEAPKNEKGDKYSFTIVVRYIRSDFSGSYGRPISDYEFFKVNASVLSYEGKDLNSASLQVLLEEFSAKNRSFDISGNYEISRVDSLSFERVTAGQSSPGVQDYYVEVKGDGVHSRGDFEYSEVADVTAHFKMRLRQSKGSWLAIGFSEYKEPEIENERPSLNYPAVNLTRDVGLKATYQKYDNAEVTIDTYRYLGDLCRLIQTEYTRPREEFEKIELMSTLFNSEEGRKVVDELYQIKKMISKYSLTINESHVKSVYGAGVKKGAQNDIEIHYSLTRKLTKDQWKQTKNDGADKKTLAITKYPAHGYLYIRVGLSTDGTKIFVKSSTIRSFLYYVNGGDTSHPLD